MSSIKVAYLKWSAAGLALAVQHSPFSRNKYLARSHRPAEEGARKARLLRLRRGLARD
jgi:hypothetical protein